MFCITVYYHQSIKKPDKSDVRKLICSSNSKQADLCLLCYRLAANSADTPLFMREAARGIPHDSETFNNRMVSSITHRFTSDYFGNPLSSSPSWPANPAPIDLFLTYNNGGNSANCFDRLTSIFILL